ncbi:MAG: signal peptidase II [Puniceicoccaceae bacterium]|nr:MAG: signal peptidase II [Puniceicoccaceae bacterium]
MQLSKTERILRYRLLFITAGVIFLLDQASKTWIFKNLELDSYHPPEAITVIENFFYIVHVGNEGAAWGMFSGYGSFLAAFALLALFVIYKMRHALELQKRPMQWAFGLLIGGILGNFVDRLVHGHVIDFLDFHFPFSIPWVMPTGRYPSFNVADCGIVIGTIFYLILSFRAESQKEKEAKRIREEET